MSAANNDPLQEYRRPRYRTLFEKAFHSLEKSGGSLNAAITFKNPTDEERRVVIGLTGVDRKSTSAEIKLRLDDLDAILTRATGFGLVEAVTKIVGDPLAKAAARERTTRLKADVLRAAENSTLHRDSEWYRDWLTWVTKHRLTRLVNNESEHVVGRAVKVFEFLDDPAGTQRRRHRPLPLPVLAVNALGDTKALDPRKWPTLNSLVLRGLALWRSIPWPEEVDAGFRREVWDAFDVVVDELASRVLVLNLPAEGPNLGEWLTGAAHVATPFQVTLHQILRHPITPVAGPVYVCENPAVLRRVSDELGVSAPPLLCTEGRPSTAFHRLAAVLTSAGCELRYHGDFDWPGVDMAAKILDRYPSAPWRMAASDYLSGLRADDLGILLHQNPRETPWDPDLSAAMKREGRAVYEEAMEDVLLADLRVLP